MKRITLICMTLLLLMAVTLAGCSKKTDGANASSPNGVSAQTAEDGNSGSGKEDSDTDGSRAGNDTDSDQTADGEKSENSDPDKPADTVTVTTDFGTLYYPDMWDDAVAIDQSEVTDKLVKVTFSAKLSDNQTLELFTLYIGEGGEEFGQASGTLTDKSGTARTVYLSASALDEKVLSKLSEGERDRCYGMQEDLNYVLDHLK